MSPKDVLPQKYWPGHIIDAWLQILGRQVRDVPHKRSGYLGYQRIDVHESWLPA